MIEDTDYPQIKHNKNQIKKIMEKILAVAGLDQSLGKWSSLDIEMAIGQVAVGTKYDFVPRIQTHIRAESLQLYSPAAGHSTWFENSQL